jgi:DNA-binding FadR family transcriptional regulator
MAISRSANDAVSHVAPMQPIRVPKTGEIVADQIRRRIIRGELNEGDFLPSEAELIETLGVSRPTLREALRVLEAEQLISVGRGSRTGARVHLPRAESVARYAGFVLQADATTIADVYQARLAIEPFVAASVAQATPAAAERLDHEIDRLESLVNAQNFVDFMIGVAQFHRSLVELSGNKTLALITRMLQEIVARYQVNFLETHRRKPSEQAKVAMTGIKSFRKLSRLIREGDAEGAATHWRDHLEISNKVWLRDSGGAEVIDVFD